MESVRAIRFRYEASEELSSLLEEFRLMCNDAIRIALKERPRSSFRLIELAYPRLKEYGLHTHYILSACEVAYSVCKNHKRKSIPRIRRPFINLDSQRRPTEPTGQNGLLEEFSSLLIRRRGINNRYQCQKLLRT